MKADRVVDMNVLSFLFRQDSRAEAYLPYLENKAIAISFQTLAELELWALVGHWGAQRKAKLAQFIAPFGIAVYSQRLGQRWAEATFSARRQGKPINGQINITERTLILVCYDQASIFSPVSSEHARRGHRPAAGQCDYQCIVLAREQVDSEKSGSTGYSGASIIRHS